MGWFHFTSFRMTKMHNVLFLLFMCWVKLSGFMSFFFNMVYQYINGYHSTRNFTSCLTTWTGLKMLLFDIWIANQRQEVMLQEAHDTSSSGVPYLTHSSLWCCIWRYIMGIFEVASVPCIIWLEPMLLLYNTICCMGRASTNSCSADNYPIIWKMVLQFHVSLFVVHCGGLFG